MKVFMNQSDHLYSLTMLHLQGWMEALEEILETEDCPFENATELALQVDHWREEFQRNCGEPNVKREPVVVITYGNQVILICNQASGEYIKLEVIPTSLWNPKTSSSVGS
jgi:hypothetical protein